MTLYPAIYQRPPHSPRALRCMTFAAQDAAEANSIAADWELPSDILLVVKPLRRLATQLELI